MSEFYKQILSIIVTAVLGQIALIPIIKNELSHMQQDIDKNTTAICKTNERVEINSNRITWLEAKAESKSRR